MKPSIVMAFAISAACFLSACNKESATQEAVAQKTLYGHIALKYPQTGARIISIKATPEAECNKWLDEYYIAMTTNCTQCEVLANACVASVPATYEGIFEQKAIATSYVYKPYSYPEVTILEGVSDKQFQRLCDTEKQGFDLAKCIYKTP